jgi:hypothetical protein
MIGSDLQLEESSIRSIQVFDSQSKTSSPKRVNHHLKKREILLKQKFEQIADEQEAQVARECTFKPKILNRPKSTKNFERRSATAFYE